MAALQERSLKPKEFMNVLLYSAERLALPARPSFQPVEPTKKTPFTFGPITEYPTVDYPVEIFETKNAVVNQYWCDLLEHQNHAV